MIKVSSRGSFRNAEELFRKTQKHTYLTQLEKYGQQGVIALRAATPVESSHTEEAWGYEIVDRPGYYSIKWTNIHVEEPGHIPVAVLIQYGHGTRNGGYVQGLDYINPAMRPIFDQIALDMWREVTK